MTTEDELANGIELRIIRPKQGTISKSFHRDARYESEDIRENVVKGLDTRTDTAKHFLLELKTDVTMSFTMW